MPRFQCGACRMPLTDLSRAFACELMLPMRDHAIAPQSRVRLIDVRMVLQMSHRSAFRALRASSSAEIAHATKSAPSQRLAPAGFAS